MRATIITIAVVVVIIIGFWLVSGLNNPSSPLNGSSSAINASKLAQHLTAEDIKMYGASWCPACANQKKLFGDGWQDVDYIECASDDGGQVEVCREAGIEAYPTWEFSDGSRREGVLSLEELSSLSGYAVPQSSLPGPISE